MASLRTWIHLLRSKNPRSVDLCFAIVIVAISLGTLVVAIAAESAKGMRFALAGPVLMGAGAILGGAVVLRDWSCVKWRHRVGGIAFVATGLFLIYAVVKWLASNIERL